MVLRAQCEVCKSSFPTSVSRFPAPWSSAARLLTPAWGSRRGMAARVMSTHLCVLQRNDATCVWRWVAERNLRRELMHMGLQFGEEKLHRHPAHSRQNSRHSSCTHEGEHSMIHLLLLPKARPQAMQAVAEHLSACRGWMSLCPDTAVSLF